MGAFKMAVNGLAVLFGLLFSIPYLGRITALVWRGVIDIFWRLISLPDVILGMFGLYPQKKLRIAVISLIGDDKEQIVKEDKLKETIQDTIETYLEAANVRVIVDKVKMMESPAPPGSLNPGCGSGALLDDIGTAGMYYEHTINKECFDSAFQRYSGYAAPIIVYVVKEVKGGDIGCSLGPFTDYVTIEGRKPQCIAHEVAHACGLLHVNDGENLAAHICGGRKLAWWQKAIVRSSRHVTYF
jgi:hypothetical protein